MSDRPTSANAASAGPAPAIPDKAARTTAENPWPVRLLSTKIDQFVQTMSVTWVEGQVVQLNRRPGARTAYITLRDADVDMSLSCSIRVDALDAMEAASGPVQPGARVVMQVKPSFYLQRGSLVMDARQIKPVGIGELLARVEFLKRQLAAEGLFAPERKRALPFVPRTIGLICGRASAAERDVISNALKRWPGATFEKREVAVQGRDAVAEVSAAIVELDEMEEVDVIVITRGGGSVEDLLAFSNETLVRTASRARTPIVSAIGHEQDSPILDHVADVRASTPTDAAKLIVPDAAAEAHTLATLRQRAGRSIQRRVHDEKMRLRAHTSRPVMANPGAYLTVQRETISVARERAHRQVGSLILRHQQRMGHLRAQARVLAPVATLERGYAIVSDSDGALISDPAQVSSDDLLRVQVARGDFAARAVGN